MSFEPSQVHLIEIENNRDLVATLNDEELGLRIDRVNLNKCSGYHDVMRKREDDLKGDKKPWEYDPLDMIDLNLVERISIKNGRFEVRSDQSEFTFDMDATEMSLKDIHILCAVLKNDDGKERYSTLDLDDYLGNDDGYFIWGGKNFSKSTGFAKLEAGGSILFAALYHEGQQYSRTNSLKLTERIINNDGQLEFR